MSKGAAKKPPPAKKAKVDPPKPPGKPKKGLTFNVGNYMTSATAAPGPLVASPPSPVATVPQEIAISFDTTGSMYDCLREVRKNVTAVIQRLMDDIPNLRVAVFAHGDYGDEYVTKYVNFTNNTKKLVKFVRDVEETSGDDWEECYELVLKESRELLSWTPGSQRSLVMIGDAIPHEVDFYHSEEFEDLKDVNQNYGAIDWRDEINALKQEVC